MKKNRKPFVAGNWKMHNTLSAARTLAIDVRERVGSLTEVEVAVCPSFTALATVVDVLRSSAVGVGAQNCHHEAKGAFTGEVAVDQIADLGCRYVIIGHSERRQLFGETDAGVARKVRAALDGKLTPIMCIGETLQEREAGRTFEVVLGQLDGGLASVTSDELSRLVLAYEPVWAIGTGKTASDEQAEEVHDRIRQRLREKHGAVADAVRIQYGGSVKPDNAKGLLGQPNIDGALVGGASLKADAFAAIVLAAHQ
ncbi:MAG: triose-phosphate isomerase [Deltaproteobacteria bacterium]|nr:triose-phosphate isomerase [Deltaproteobacteria bacterium]